jgi:hypothetical protein
MTMPDMDTITYFALGALGLAVLYSMGLFDRLLGRSASTPAPTPAPAPQPIAPPAQPTFFAGDPTPPPAPDPYSLLLAHHAMALREADLLAAQRIHLNAVYGLSVGRERDIITTIAQPSPQPIPLPAPTPQVQPEAAPAAPAKARTAAARKAAK